MSQALSELRNLPEGPARLWQDIDQVQGHEGCTELGDVVISCPCHRRLLLSQGRSEWESGLLRLRLVLLGCERETPRADEFGDEVDYGNDGEVGVNWHRRFGAGKTGETAVEPALEEPVECLMLVTAALLLERPLCLAGEPAEKADDIAFDRAIAKGDPGCFIGQCSPEKKLHEMSQSPRGKQRRPEGISGAKHEEKVASAGEVVHVEDDAGYFPEFDQWPGGAHGWLPPVCQGNPAVCASALECGPHFEGT